MQQHILTALNEAKSALEWYHKNSDRKPGITCDDEYGAYITAMNAINEALEKDQPFSDTGQLGAVWRKGAPERFNRAYFAKVKSKIDEDTIHHAVISKRPDGRTWWAVGMGFQYDVTESEIIEYYDDYSTQQTDHGLPDQR